MSINRDHLDDVIDRVSARLTHVDEDPLFAARVIASLPERVTWFGWLTHSWAPRLAMIAIVAGAAVLWNGRKATEVAPVLQPLTVAAVASQWTELTLAA